MEKQIKVLEKIIQKDSCKNKYAVNNKIKTLKKKVKKQNILKSWNNYLSQ